MALIVVLLLVTVFAVLGSTAMLATSTDLQISSNYRMSEQALYAAEAGAEYGLNRLRAALAVLGGSTGSVVPPALSGFTFENTGSFLVADPVGVVEKAVTGNFSGLTAYCQKYTLTSAALKTNTTARAAVVYDVEDQLIPLFQFGIFYHNDLEMLPGANMTFSGGRIHSNHDIYMSTSATLTVNSIVTTAGDILHKRKNTGVTEAGAVQIRDAAGAYHNLTLDSETDPSWQANALADWNGRVKSEVHGIQSINLPLPEGSQPIDTLGTGSGSLYEKSGLRIIDGVAKDKNGNTIDLTAGGNFDQSDIERYRPLFTTEERQRGWGSCRWISTYLRNNTVAMAALNDPPAGGEAGILYVSSTSAYLTNPAVRLVNGGTLPLLPDGRRGLSVTTNNPLYVKGDYNTYSGGGAAGIYADAVTVLSNSWSDANAAGTHPLGSQHSCRFHDHGQSRHHGRE